MKLSALQHITLGVLVALPLVGAGGQSNSPQAPEDTVKLYGNLGTQSRRVTTGSEVAQAYFDEGLRFMFAFGASSGLASFREAQKHDPNCAMCFWGEAWALSPYLNGRMGLEEEQKAYRAIRSALELSDYADNTERALIEAFSVRYAEEPTEEMRRPLDTLYSRAMAGVVREHPDDLDAATLYGESLMLLRPRRGSVDLNDPAVVEILSILEGVLDRDIRHAGACHLYIHLVEASPEPGRAEACSDYLGDAIPGASHIRHMPSHIYMNIGRYGDAVRANQTAWHVDQQAAYGGPPGIYPTHNLHMLLFAATLDGQSAVAIQAARDVGRIAPAYSFYYPVALATFGRWDDVLELSPAYDDPFQEGMWHFARGMALLRTKGAQEAHNDLLVLNAIIESLPDSLQFRFHPQTTLLRIPAGILGGEMAAADGRYDDAVALLEEAIEIEDGLVYDEPEPWHLPVRHALGAVLLEAGRAAAAERVFTDALLDHPANGWALFGLSQALDEQNKVAEADKARSDYAKYWARRDIWLRSSRF